MLQFKNIHDVPVSVFISVCIIIIFLLYITSILKSIPCNNDVISIFISNFVHTNFLHLFSNLYAIYALSRVEQAIGGKQFIILVVFLLVLNTLLETLVNRKLNIPCSIGFSGVLYGIMTWELVTQKHLDFFYIYFDMCYYNCSNVWKDQYISIWTSGWCYIWYNWRAIME